MINRDLVRSKDKVKFMEDFTSKHLFKVLTKLQTYLEANLKRFGYAAIPELSMADMAVACFLNTYAFNKLRVA